MTTDAVVGRCKDDNRTDEGLKTKLKVLGNVLQMLKHVVIVYFFVLRVRVRVIIFLAGVCPPLSPVNFFSATVIKRLLMG